MSILDQFRLDGRRALVTGCKQGIGMAVATALAQAGADIVGVDLGFSKVVAENDATDVAVSVRKAGRRFAGYQCNFADRASLYEFIARVKQDFPQIDILFNNAGTIRRKPAAEHPDEFWDEVIAVNLNAQFILTREIGKVMVSRGSGKIVFIASLLSFQGGITVPGYAASKGGVAQLVKAFANEWAVRGVNVNAIAPGYIATANTAALRADENRSRTILERIPAGRWGEPDDLVGAAVFLCSDAARYVHGTVLTIDGGWMGR